MPIRDAKERRWQIWSPAAIHPDHRPFNARCAARSRTEESSSPSSQIIRPPKPMSRA